MQAESAIKADEPTSTVLVVDDTPENIAVMGGLLSPQYRVRVANSGAVALRMAVIEPMPDLILLDVMMPEMSGHEVMEKLRADIRTRDVPIIFVTALNDVEAEEHGLDVGAADYIVKPVKPAVMLARVRAQLNAKRARDFLRDQNAFLEQEIARRMADNLLIQDVSIHALARLAETRDPDTGNHLMRTREYVRCLAERLRDHPRFAAFLTERNIQLLPKSAPLHDIGKVGIPDTILLKPGPLSSEEWAVMRTHAAIGSDAIEAAERDTRHAVEFLQLAKEVVRSHHEKWDGTGYPDGLAGEAIPVAARLMALADVFDALISRRVYKPPLSYAQSREVIVDGRGTHFDPEVVDAFLASYGEFCDIADCYRDTEPRQATLDSGEDAP